MAKYQDDLLADLGRFSEPALYILISLADSPKHGYAMTLDIEAVTGQKLGPGTLYGPLPGSKPGNGSSRCRPRSGAAPTDSQRRASACCATACRTFMRWRAWAGRDWRRDSAARTSSQAVPAGVARTLWRGVSRSDRGTPAAMARGDRYRFGGNRCVAVNRGEPGDKLVSPRNQWR